MKRFVDRFSWWLMGCPFTGWRGEPRRVPWDYRLGMRLRRPA